MKTRLIPTPLREILVVIENGKAHIAAMSYGIDAEVRDYDKGATAKPGEYKTDIDGRPYVLQPIVWD